MSLHEVEFNLAPGLTLIYGQSGAGKTTILKAIKWVLFGTVRRVYNHKGKGKACEVHMSDIPTKKGTITIIRKKNPNVLEISIDGKNYSNKVAQDLIESFFGSEQLWSSVSYVAQKSICGFLSASANDKFKLLNDMALSESPEKYIKVVKDRIIQATKKIDALTRDNNVHLMSVRSRLKERPAKRDQILTDVEIADIKERIITLKKSKINNQLVMSKGVLSEMCHKITKDTGADISAMLSEIKDLEQTCTEMRRSIASEEAMLKTRIRKKNLMDELSAIPEVSDTNISIENLRSIEGTLKSLREVGKKNPSYIDVEIDLNGRKCIAYGVDVIGANVNSLSHDASIALKLSTILSRAKPYTISAKTIDEILSMLKSSVILDVFTCPSCQSNIAQSHEKMIVVDNMENIDYLKAQRMTIQGIIKDLSSINVKLDNAELFRKLDFFHEPIDGVIIFVDDKASEFKKFLAFVKDINLVFDRLANIPYNITSLSDVNSLMLDVTTKIANKSTIEKRRIIQREIGLISDSTPVDIITTKKDLTFISNKIAEKISTVSVLKNAYGVCTKELAKIRRSGVGVGEDDMDLISKIVNMDVTDTSAPIISDLEKRLSDSEHAKWALGKKEELDAEKKVIARDDESLDRFTRILDIMRRVEYSLFQECVDSVNLDIDLMIKKFFVSDITVQISLYKEIKSRPKDSNITKEITLRIFDGSEISYGDLSGGELDRVSLIVAVSLMRMYLTSFPLMQPLLLLDEPLAIDSESFIQCLDHIKGMLPDVSVMVTRQDIIDGFFDSYIRM